MAQRVAKTTHGADPPVANRVYLVSWGLWKGGRPKGTARMLSGVRIVSFFSEAQLIVLNLPALVAKKSIRIQKWTTTPQWYPTQNVRKPEGGRKTHKMDVAQIALLAESGTGAPKIAQMLGYKTSSVGNALKRIKK